jgi:hypothetical protein
MYRHGFFSVVAVYADGGAAEGEGAESGVRLGVNGSGLGQGSKAAGDVARAKVCREDGVREVRGLGGAVFPPPARRRRGRGRGCLAASAFLVLPSAFAVDPDRPLDRAAPVTAPPRHRATPAKRQESRHEAGRHHITQQVSPSPQSPAGALLHATIAVMGMHVP